MSRKSQFAPMVDELSALLRRWGRECSPVEIVEVLTSVLGAVISCNAVSVPDATDNACQLLRSIVEHIEQQKAIDARINVARPGSG